jgi:hypothetical protein
MIQKNVSGILLQEIDIKKRAASAALFDRQSEHLRYLSI